MIKIQLTTALVITVLSNFTVLSPINAQLTTSKNNSINFNPPPPPPDRSAAGDRGQAASRGCGNGTQSVMALVPDYKQTINLEGGEKIPVTKIWGLTTEDYPTFWFVVPYEKSSITKMEFVIKDESQKPSKTIYKTLLNKPEIPGIIGVSTNRATEALQISKTKHQKNYHWFLKVRVKCNPQQPAQLQAVDGWIERISLNSSLAQRLQKATPKQQVALYAENGMWHNSLTTLAKLRLAKPKDTSLLSDWTSLLKSEELHPFANYPLLNCCEAQ